MEMSYQRHCREPQSQYLPHLDGLRALSVLLVLIYHLDLDLGSWNIFKGGFVGVDVFFVLSGYLISRNLLSELQKQEKVHISGFLIRRARRILPLVSFVLVAVSIAAYFLLLPEDLIEFSKSLLSILVFFQNFYFYFDGLNYHAQQTNPPILLHFWSLAIEKHFYLLCPLFFAFFHKFNVKIIGLVFVAILLISILLADILANTHNYRALNFYFTVSRLWEFSAGAILAFISFRTFHEKLSVLGDVGIVVIVLSAVFFNSNVIHPGLITVVPVFGAALVIFFGKDCYLSCALKNPIVRMLGKISFGIYLWHFALISLARYSYIDLHILDKFLIIIITIILSWASFYLIEKNFQTKFSTRFFILFVAVSYLILLSFVFFVVKNEGLNHRFPEIFSSKFSSFTPYLLKQDDVRCFSRWKNFCNFGGDSEVTVYIVGDSHASSIAYSVSKQLKDSVNIKVMADGGCYFLPNTDMKFQGRNTSCDNQVQKRRWLEIEPKNGILLVAGNLGEYLTGATISGDFAQKAASANDKSVDENFMEAIDELANSGMKIILVYPFPEMKVTPSNYLFSWYKQTQLPTIFPEIHQKLNDYMERQGDAFKLLDAVKHQEVHRIYPHKIFCGSGDCKANNQRKIFFTDKTHLSESGLDLFYPILAKQLSSLIEKFKSEKK